ncbi:hypothetical protein BGW36DRAFT_466637 [Talaromyces proteolyticus]|uniref:MalT-like TPR region domain-containing protein n=1 Tax=Talaromyces proteolyticus TaxID=1131652 RepID=A0AAD4PTQ1_9EURO|nr:uncharacterized protein BGW36DRAFT_466637 [Talaromyces proteolyticus]KAH8689074.1 hypothetical protein BGW36DRAFT_466637 [Talaromyces proteolyticus]
MSPSEHLLLFFEVYDFLWFTQTLTTLELMKQTHSLLLSLTLLIVCASSQSILDNFPTCAGVSRPYYHPPAPIHPASATLNLLSHISVVVSLGLVILRTKQQSYHWQKHSSTSISSSATSTSSSATSTSSSATSTSSLATSTSSSATSTSSSFSGTNSSNTGLSSSTKLIISLCTVFGFILLLTLIAAVYFYVKRRRRQNPEISVPEPPPLEYIGKPELATGPVQVYDVPGVPDTATELGSEVQQVHDRISTPNLSEDYVRHTRIQQMASLTSTIPELDGARFCGYCGKESRTRFCKHCGKQRMLTTSEIHAPIALRHDTGRSYLRLDYGNDSNLTSQTTRQGSLVTTSPEIGDDLSGSHTLSLDPPNVLEMPAVTNTAIDAPPRSVSNEGTANAALSSNAFQEPAELHADSNIHKMEEVALEMESRGEYTAAEDMRRQIVQWRSKEQGPEHLDTLSSMYRLVLVFDNQCKYKEADDLYRQVLALTEKALGPNPGSPNIGEKLMLEKKYEVAEQVDRQEIGLNMRVLGPGHRFTVLSTGNLANVLRIQRKFKDAEESYQRTLKLSEEVFGLDHAYTLQIMNNLGLVLSIQDKNEEAREMFRQALERTIGKLGLDHPETFIALRNLKGMLENGEDVLMAGQNMATLSTFGRGSPSRRSRATVKISRRP